MILKTASYYISSKKTYVLVIAIFITYISYVISLFTWCKGYYTYEDLLGPLSKSFIIALSLGFFLLLSLTYFLVTRNDGGLKVVSLLVLLLVISSVYILPDIADSYYDQNFYDAGAHMARGAFVTLTGHSDPNIDGYFDLQPAFFWFTAMFINIVYGTPTSPSDPIFSFLIKWFHVIASTLYILTLYLFFRKHGLENTREVFLALSLFFILNLSRFHYSAQAYAYMLFWFLLSILPDVVRNGEVRKNFTLLPVLTVAVFVHQGIVIFMIVTLLSALMFLLSSKQWRGDLLNILMLLTHLLFIWFLYLLYISEFTLSNFISTIINIINRGLAEGPTEIAQTALWRAWQPWEYVVKVKAAYMIISILTVITLTIWMYKITMNESYKFRAFIILGILSSLVPITLALGGAGYTERVHIAILPFTALILVETAKLPKQYRILKKVIILSITCLIIIAPVVFFSGRNFQSIPTSEDKSMEFLMAHVQSVMRIYSEVSVRSAFTPFLTNSTPTRDTIYFLHSHEFIQIMYYVTGDIATLDSYAYRLKLTCSTIYFNPTAQFLQC
jgi:hypothetical protein